MILFLFASTVLIWGTSWIAIAFQVGDVPVVVSIFYRFAIAGGVFVAVLVVLGKLKVPAVVHWPWIFLQAVCLFCLNFISFYMAALYVTSGLLAVIFSISVLFNAINARIFFGEPITRKAIVACAFGLTGLAFLFGPDIASGDNVDTLKGIALACLGTLFFSFGNMVSRHLSKKQVTPVTANAWGMCCGAVLLLTISQVAGFSLTVPTDLQYWGALLYLSVFGSVLAFTTYLLLLDKTGPAQAAYVTILFPVVALTISTFYEGYQWTYSAVLGAGLAILGNVIMFSKTPNRSKGLKGRFKWSRS